MTVTLIAIDSALRSLRQWSSSSQSHLGKITVKIWVYNFRGVSMLGAQTSRAAYNENFSCLVQVITALISRLHTIFTGISLLKLYIFNLL